MLAGHPADSGTPVKAAAAKGHTKKHAVKHHKHKAHHHTAKHHPAASGHTSHITVHKAKVHTKAKHATHHEARGLALSPGDVACCAAEALAASLRLSGVPVSDEDVLALYWHTADDPEAGASIEATLEAAWRYGLGGVRPASHDQISLPGGQLHAATLGELDDLAARGLHGGSLILGVDLPGPHTVLATPDGWWSWGEAWCPCEFPDAVIEEAWAVTWA